VSIFQQQIGPYAMDPYAKPNERKTGARRPKVLHLPPSIEARTQTERRKQKEIVAAERRAIKKSARRHLKKQMLNDLSEIP
jgi:hypothetical protein